MSDLNIALVLRFIDQATAPARKAMEGLQATGQQVESFGRTQIAAGREQAQIARQQQQQMRGEVMGLVGMVTSIYAGLRGPVLFEQEMSKVGAVSKATSEELVAMTDEAERLGEKTHHSALRAAEGMRFLGMAGFETHSILAAMPGVLDMAMANDASVADAARLSSDFLDQFGLSADRMGYVADVITNVTTSANTDFMALGETMKNSGVTANMLGLEFHELAGMAGRLAARGFVGAEAGTGLSRMLLALVSPTDNAVKALQQLNVQTTDAEGNLRPIPDLMREMGTAMQHMGDVERSSLMQTIFGTYALRPANILMEEAMSGRLQQYQQDILDTGSAARVAGLMADNTAGDFMLMGSAMASVAISIGRAVLPEIRASLQTITPLIQALSGWIRENPELVTQLARVAAVMITLRLGLFMLRWAFWALFGGMAQLRIAAGFLAVVFGRLMMLSAFLAARALPFLIASTLALVNAFFFAGRMAVLALWGVRALAAGLWMLASRAAVAALAGLRALGAVAILMGRAFLVLAGRAALAAVAGLRAIGAAALWLGRALALAARALLLNPIGLAIVAIAAAVYVIYQNWDGIVSYFTDKIGRVAQAFDQGLLNGVLALIAEFNPFVLITDAAEGLFTYLTGWTFDEMNSALIGFIGFDPFTEIMALAERFFTYVTGWTFDDVGQALRSAFDIDLYAVGVDLITRLGEGIWSVLTGLVGRIRSELANIAPDWLVNGVNRLRGGGGGSANPAAGPGGVAAGARALGGPVRPGFVYEINEQGREFFMPDVPGRVVPANLFEGTGASATNSAPLQTRPTAPQTSGQVERFTSLVERLPAIPGMSQSSTTREITSQSQSAQLIERVSSLVERLPAIPGLSQISTTREMTSQSQSLRLIERVSTLVERMPVIPGLSQISTTREITTQSQSLQLIERVSSLVERLPDISGPFSDAPSRDDARGVLGGVAKGTARPDVTYQGDTINLTIHATDGQDIERQMQRFFERRDRERRYALHDGGFHD